MPKLDEQFDTQVDESSNVEDSNIGDGSSDADGDADGKSNEPFLAVNDRQVYKTREDAIRAIDESGRRIAQLSGWEKELSDYGVTEPRVARQLFDELVTLRQFKTQQEAAAQKEKQTEGTPTETHSDLNLNTEEAKAFAWLKKVLPAMGYVPKTDVTKLVEGLQAQLQGMTQEREQEQAQRRDNLIQEGKRNIVQWMTDAKLQDNEEHVLQGMIEGYIRDWINSDEKLVSRFYAGGGETNSLIKEGFERATKALGVVRSASTSTANSRYAADKKNAQKRNPRTLPQQGLPGQRSGQERPQVKRNAAGKVDHIGNAHNAAWEAFQGKVNPNAE